MLCSTHFCVASFVTNVDVAVFLRLKSELIELQAEAIFPSRHIFVVCIPLSLSLSLFALSRARSLSLVCPHLLSALTSQSHDLPYLADLWST